VHRRNGIALLAIVLLLSACGESATGPVDVHFDRATCERCRMVLSDRFHAAQVRLGVTENGGGGVHLFDDLGCALVWLQEQPSRDDPGTEIWVNHWQSGKWIDARSAFYVPEQVTPMGYGLGAQTIPGPGTLTFAEARARVLAIEKTSHANRGRPQPSQTQDLR